MTRTTPIAPDATRGPTMTETDEPMAGVRRALQEVRGDLMTRAAAARTADELRAVEADVRMVAPVMHAAGVRVLAAELRTYLRSRCADLADAGIKGLVQAEAAYKGRRDRSDVIGRLRKKTEAEIDALNTLLAEI